MVTEKDYEFTIQCLNHVLRGEEMVATTKILEKCKAIYQSTFAQLQHDKRVFDEDDAYQDTWIKLAEQLQKRQWTPIHLTLNGCHVKKLDKRTLQSYNPDVIALLLDVERQLNQRIYNENNYQEELNAIVFQLIQQTGLVNLGWKIDTVAGLVSIIAKDTQCEMVCQIKEITRSTARRMNDYKAGTYIPKKKKTQLELEEAAGRTYISIEQSFENSNEDDYYFNIFNTLTTGESAEDTYFTGTMKTKADIEDMIKLRKMYDAGVTDKMLKRKCSKNDTRKKAFLAGVLLQIGVELSDLPDEYASTIEEILKIK